MIDEIVMKAKFKIWLEEKGGVAFAEGRKMLLESIERLGVIECGGKGIRHVIPGGVGQNQGNRKGVGDKIVEGCYGWQGRWRCNPDTRGKGTDLEV